MIVAAYAGCGKTTFTREVWNSIDMVIMPYKYNVKSEPCGNNTEEDKTGYEYDMNKNWPRNYVSAVISAYHRYRYVVIPTVIPVLRELQRFRLPYVLCYPERRLKEEYTQRFRNRGNSKNFEEIFVDRWDEFIDLFEADAYAEHIKLKSGEYIKDHFKEIAEFAKTECMMPLCTDETMEEDIQRIFEETGVCIEEQLRQFMLYLIDHKELAEEWEKEGMIMIPRDYEMMRIII